MSDSSELHCFRIEDGESHVYAAHSEEDALNQHCSIYDIDDFDMDCITVEQIDDESELTIIMGDPFDSDAPEVTKKAREWIESEGRGNLSTTAW